MDSKEIDTLDLMRDEFFRIRNLCNEKDPIYFSEIRGLCDRAISGIQRRVPLIVENEKRIDKFREIRNKLDELKENIDSYLMN